MLKEMTDAEFTRTLVEKCDCQDLEIEALKNKLNERSLAVANRICISFLEHEETDCADENYKLLMLALSKQKNEYLKLKQTK